MAIVTRDVTFSFDKQNKNSDPDRIQLEYKHIKKNQVGEIESCDTQ